MTTYVEKLAFVGGAGASLLRRGCDRRGVSGRPVRASRRVACSIDDRSDSRADAESGLASVPEKRALSGEQRSNGGDWRQTALLTAGGLIAGSALLPAYAASATLDAVGAGFSASFLLILASEIGDKTFFISALLSMKYSRMVVFLGSILALGLMTVISVLLGQIFHAVPAQLNLSIPFDDYAAVALLVWFGFQNIRDGLQMSNDEDDELKDAEEYLKDAESGKQKWWQTLSSTGGLRLLLQTFSLVFVAEWGDKSMIATIALAAAKSPVGVVVGGVAGHVVATIIAVLGGSLLGKYVSEKTARLIGGALFLVFALLTLRGLY